MINEAIGVGATVEEAKEKALAELNADFTADVQIEVLETPKKKMLGLLGETPARVRVFYETPDKPEKSECVKPRLDKAEKPVKKQVKPFEKAPADPIGDSKKNTENENKSSPDIAALDFIPASEADPDSPNGRACKYIADVLDKLGCTDVVIRVAQTENGCCLDLAGNGLGVVIGRRGETLDALQYLTSLAANSKESGYYRVVLNIGDYRQRRETTLKNVARRMASQVLRTGRSRSLEPMNPYERRIIHTTIQEIDGVSSNSIGDGASRRVVISPENKKGRPPRSRDSHRSNAPSVDLQREPHIDANDMPLYGKIK